MATSRQVNVVFNEVNAVEPAHAIKEDQVQTATNVDFSLGQGALIPRRGCSVFGTVVAGTAINTLFRSYTVDNNPPFYALGSNGVVYRGTANSWTAITSNVSSLNRVGMSAFGTFAYISAGTAHIKDDGTNTTDWIKQSPGIPTITVNTLAPISYSTGSFSVFEGTAGTGSSTCTASVSANNRITFLMLLNGTSGVNLTVNGTHTIGDFGVHFVDLAFSDPTLVTRVTQDWSIGDANFYNYWHQSLDPSNVTIDTNGQLVEAASQGSPSQLIDNQLNVGTNTTQPLTADQRDQILSQIQLNNHAGASVITRLANTFSPWAVARPDFSLVGTVVNTSGANLWSSIFAVKYSIEFTGTATATIRTPAIAGAIDFPLTDVDGGGYSWWQTYATIDANSNLIGESAPSSPSATQHMQNANVTVVTTSTVTGSHGITHTITYRQGGLLRDAYAVSTTTLATATITDTLNDIQAASINNVLQRNLLNQTTFPTSVECQSEPFQNRIFINDGGAKIRWSLPGKPDSYPATSVTQVSHDGDPVYNLIVWYPGLVIVNRYSIYEMQGGDFENGDWSLVKSGSAHGAIAPRVAIKTPYGIPLLHYDGLTMYRPGEGVDQEVAWLDQKYVDAFRGGNTDDPAAIKGNRIPAINRSALDVCGAAYSEHKLYISAPVGISNNPNTVFTLDFKTQKAWWYTYSFNIKNLFWDYIQSRLFATTDDGRVMQIETSQQEHTTAGAASSFTWTATTRKYSVPNDTCLEHAYIDCISPGGISVSASFDGTTTALATLTNTTRQWQYVPLNGTFANNVEFSFTGTASGASPIVYQMHFDLMEEPPRTQYWRSEYEENNTPVDKIWDVVYFDYALRNSTGTVTAVTFVDNTAVMTNSLVLSSIGRTVSMAAFPSETYGRVAYTTYTSPVLFQLWDTRVSARNEPPLITAFTTPKLSGAEHEWKVFTPELNPMGNTVLATSFVDGTAVMTSTITGSTRQMYSIAMPLRTFGRTLWTKYSSSGAFKRYPGEDEKLEYEGVPEPSKVKSWRSGPTPYPSSHFLRTWLPHIDCLGGTVTAALLVDDNLLSTATLTGSYQQWYTVGLDISVSNAIQTGSRWEAVYTSPTNFKHYETKLESEAKPFGKSVWAYIYHKQGGVSQLDMPRFFSIEAEALSSATCTYYVDIDSTNFTTGTFTLTGGIQWFDRIALPPGGRGRLFELRINAGAGNIKVYKANFDFMQEGVKGLTRRETAGTPDDQLSYEGR